MLASLGGLGKQQKAKSDVECVDVEDSGKRGQECVVVIRAFATAGASYATSWSSQGRSVALHNKSQERVRLAILKFSMSCFAIFDGFFDGCTLCCIVLHPIFREAMLASALNSLESVEHMVLAGRPVRTLSLIGL